MPTPHELATKRAARLQMNDADGAAADAAAYAAHIATEYPDAPEI